MKSKRNELLILSLYFPKRKWKKLFVEGISTFLNLPSHKNLILNYKIYFSSYGGDNIRFELGVEAINAISILKSADIHFNNFFSQFHHFFSNVKVRKKLENGFMHFPTYSIQYGLSVPTTNSYINKRDIDKIQFMLSKLIIKHVEQNGLSEQNILLFIFKLAVVAIVKILGCNDHEIHLYKFFEDHMKSLGYHQNFSEYLNNIYLENKLVLIEVHLLIMENINNKPYFELNSILELAKNYNIQDMTVNSQVLKEILNVIYSQLNLSFDSKLIVGYFLQEIFCKEKCVKIISTVKCL